MVSRIDLDAERFRLKTRKLKEKGLERYLSDDGFLVPQPDGSTARIPIPIIEIPRLRLGSSPYPTGGVGQGDGDIGDAISVPGTGDSDGSGGLGHGSGAGTHDFADVSREDAADFLRKKLCLPDLLEKFSGSIDVTRRRYHGIQTTGPESLRHFKRTYREALKRSISSGTYQPGEPVFPVKDDKRYRAPKTEITPATKAVIFYLLDYSGSMHDVITFHQNVGWWADAWITTHYPRGVERRFVQYDSEAQEISSEHFFSVGAGGGTSMHAGLSLVRKLLERDYPESDFNAYLIHFTDGDSFGLSFSSEELTYYKNLLKEAKNKGWDTHGNFYLDELRELANPNPLTAFLVPRCNAIFVCEAGYFASGNTYNFNGGTYRGNYSQQIMQFLRRCPALEPKVRVVSYKSEYVQSYPGKCLRTTLEKWFG